MRLGIHSYALLLGPRIRLNDFRDRETESPFPTPVAQWDLAGGS